MRGHGEEHRMGVWILNHKDEKAPENFLVDGYELETNRVCQFHGCHRHGHTCIKNCTIRQKMRYKDTWRTD